MRGEVLTRLGHQHATHFCARQCPIRPGAALGQQAGSDRAGKTTKHKSGTEKRDADYGNFSEVGGSTAREHCNRNEN